MMRCGPIRCWL